MLVVAYNGQISSLWTSPVQEEYNYQFAPNSSPFICYPSILAQIPWCITNQLYFNVIFFTPVADANKKRIRLGRAESEGDDVISGCCALSNGRRETNAAAVDAEAVSDAVWMLNMQ